MGLTQRRATELNQHCHRQVTAGAASPNRRFSDGAEWWLANDFHRYQAAQRVGAVSFPALVRLGTKRDAVLFAVGSNQESGLRRTNEDTRKAVLMLLRVVAVERSGDCAPLRRPPFNRLGCSLTVGFRQ